MTAQQLKNSILQMAVQGKLVPQNPDDEPASILLERIRAEKQELIKQGKIKKEKPLSPISDDEIPFEIPESWCWCRLGEISTYAHTKKKINAIDADKSLWQLDLEDIEKGGRLIIKHTVGELKAKGDKTYFEKGDILYSKLRPYLLKILVADDNGICTPEIVPFKLFGNILSEYMINLLKSPYVDTLVNGETYGVKMPRAGTDTMVNILVPLPPLSEQKRIVEKIEELLPFIEQYEKAETQLNTLNTSFPDMLKKSILQYAVQGKLVPQNADDEPASVLLERIRTEKQELIKQGKIKKEKPLSPISDDEIPFEIPESWCWCRLGEISTYAHTKKKINAIDADKSLWQLDLEDIEKGGRLIIKHTVGELKAKGDKTYFEKGDILYSKLRPYLLKILVADDNGICTPEIVPFKLFGNILSEYMINLLKSPYVDTLVNGETYGVKMPRAGTDTMVNILVPLPPLSEQKRIVEKIEKLMPIIDGINK